MTRNRLPLPILIATVLTIVAVMVIASSPTKKATQRTVAAGSAISLAHTRVGKALADADGRIVYLFAGDKANMSLVSAAGRAVWPPFTSITLPAAAGGASAAQIGTIAGKQITYNGHPLYYYVGDHHAGRAAGQGLNEFGARWYVVSGAGAAITSAVSSTSATRSETAPSTGGGAGYGY
jgi:predicted lipoprotein with Yx(FWY)xxD motif